MDQRRPERHPMRVIHLDHTTALGGAELALRRLLAARRFWSAVLLVPANPAGQAGAFEPLFGLPSVEIIKIGPAQEPGASKSGFRAAGLLRYAMSMSRSALAIRGTRVFSDADIVHANTSRSGIYGALACLGTSKVFVVHLRDAVTTESLGRVGKFAFTRLVLARADGVIANSQYTLNTAAPYLRESAAREVIPSAFGNSSTARINVVSRTVNSIGMLARIDPWKGQDLLIRAFAEEFRGTSVKLTLAGGAQFGHQAFEKELREMVSALGVEPQVEFLGNVDDVAGYIAKTDICVQASLRAEPLGQNVLQYLAAGRPVVAADAGGPLEWVRDGVNGCLFRSGSVESLRSVLRRLADSYELRDMLAQAALATPGLLTDDEVAEAHLRLFSRALAMRPVAGRRSKNHSA